MVMLFDSHYIYLSKNTTNTYDHRVWKTGLPVRSAVLKPHAGSWRADIFSYIGSRASRVTTPVSDVLRLKKTQGRLYTRHCLEQAQDIATFEASHVGHVEGIALTVSLVRYKEEHIAHRKSTAFLRTRRHRTSLRQGDRLLTIPQTAKHHTTIRARYIFP
ncbi:hypothetical protein BO96DRAFT_427087 [Aspergillus niger CBS 101883]|nr:uncharacterized protein BO96DRAFT_427087 [Aspergillus niger CBS 101883]PYH51749.1 hypothetical protein BO96DRAFT_427087 [Aspergillus niger CBS 101883]